MSTPPRVVVVHRPSELEELVLRHGTRGHVEFFLSRRGRTLTEVQQRHDALEDARRTVATAVPDDWRHGSVSRADLDRFLFDPAEIVVAVGPDGLVANVAKYLADQPVIGVDPDLGRNPGVLVTRAPAELPGLLLAVAAGSAPVTARTMVTARGDDGQELTALNEIHLGHPNHQSARYTLTTPDGAVEQQSSSGLVAGTGTGSTGWCRSLWLERHSPLTLPRPAEPGLAWFVREAWPSPTTGTNHTEGLVAAGQRLQVGVDSDSLLVFGDGLETDRLTVTWGQVVTVEVAGSALQHIV